jgi:hypothetical protein
MQDSRAILRTCTQGSRVLIAALLCTVCSLAAPESTLISRVIASYYEPVEERATYQVTRTVPGVPRRDQVEVQTRGIQHSLRLTIHLAPEQKVIDAKNLEDRNEDEFDVESLKDAAKECLKSEEADKLLTKTKGIFRTGNPIPEDKIEEFRDYVDSCLSGYKPPEYEFVTGFRHETTQTNWRNR